MFGYERVVEHYRAGPDRRFDLKYHFDWITKYRKGGELGGLFENWCVKSVGLTRSRSYWARPRATMSTFCSRVVRIFRQARSYNTSKGSRQREDVAEAADGVSAPAEAVLGTALVGEGILRGVER